MCLKVDMINEELFIDLESWFYDDPDGFWEDLKKYDSTLYQQLLLAAQDATAKELESIKNDI